MMEENREDLFRLALHIHGHTFSESGSDSDDGYAEFDQTHEQNKPPPLDPEFIRKNLIVIHPKKIENVWVKRVEARSKKTENIKVGTALCPISNHASTFVPDVENSSGISEKKVSNQKLEMSEHGSTNTPSVKAEIKYVDPKSHLLHDSCMETSSQGQSSLEIINSLVAKKEKKKRKKKKKKKSANEKNNEEISPERSSHSIVSTVGNSVSTKVDEWVTRLEKLDYVPSEMEASEDYNYQWNVISPEIYYETEKIQSDDENRNNNFMPLDTNNAVAKNDEFAKISGIKEENVQEEKVTTNSNLYAKPQEQTNCRKEISSTGQINGIKKKKVKYVPCNLLDEKFSTSPQTTKDCHNQPNSRRKKKLKGVKKKKDLDHNNISKLDNSPNSCQELALSPLVICETNNEFYRNFPQLNANLLDENNEITEVTETKPKTSYEEKNSSKLASYKSVNLQDEANNANKELSSAKTEASSKKKKETKFVPANLLDETVSTIPPVSHIQQNSLNRLTSNEEPCSQMTASGTRKKRKIQGEPGNILNETLSTITSKAEFSHTQQIMPNCKTFKGKKGKNRGLGPLSPYSGDIDNIPEIPHIDQKNFDEVLQKYESIFLNCLNYQQNIIVTDNRDREGTSGTAELSLASGVRKKKKKKGKVSRLKINPTESENIFRLINFGFSCNIDLGSHLGVLKQINSCYIGFSSFNANIKEREDKTYRNKAPYYEENIILLSFATELEKTFLETEWQNEEITRQIFGYRPKAALTNLNYFENIQHGLELCLYSGNTLEGHNLNELISYGDMCMDFMSYTGEHDSSCKGEKRISVLVQPCHDYSEFSLKEDPKTDHCLRKDFMYNDSTKETKNQRDTLTESNEEEMLHFTLKCEEEETNSGSVRRRGDTILIKADNTGSDTSDHYDISYISEKYSEDELGRTVSNHIKNEISQKTITTVLETSKVPYPFTKVVQLIFVCVFLYLVISFMHWVTDNCLPLTLFFMCIIILNNAN